MTHEPHNDGPSSQDELLAHVIPMRHRAADQTQLQTQDPTDEHTPPRAHSIWDPSPDPLLPRRAPPPRPKAPTPRLHPTPGLRPTPGPPPTSRRPRTTPPHARCAPPSRALRPPRPSGWRSSRCTAKPARHRAFRRSSRARRPAARPSRRNAPRGPTNPTKTPPTHPAPPGTGTAAAIHTRRAIRSRDGQHARERPPRRPVPGPNRSSASNAEPEP